jgi:hypothetical protein
MANNSIEVNTPKGKIKAYLSTDPNYPGIYIDINDEGAALIEFQDNTQQHVIHIWRQSNEEPDERIVWDKG